MASETVTALGATGRAHTQVRDTGPVVSTVASDGDRGAWDAFVVAHRPAASGYHEWAWRDVFARAFGHRNHYLIARRAGQIEGVLPLVQIDSRIFGRSLTSLPFVNYGGIVADSPEAAHELLGAAAGLARQLECRHVELRHVARRFPDLPCRQHKVGMWLRLESGLWDRLDRKVRNQVRKAEKSGLTVARGGAELLPDFYRVFARNMRDLGTPVYSRRLFSEALRAFPDRMRVLVVYRGTAPIAAGVAYRTGDRVEVPWASSIRDYNALCPNHLLYWRAIETAANEGAEVFDFGRSTPDEGTYRFKAQWGAEPVPMHWEYAMTGGGEPPDQSPKNPKFQLAIAAWKRCPLWLANHVGPRVVRGIP